MSAGERSTPRGSEAWLSLHRYFIWANRMRTHFDELLQAHAHESAAGLIESRLYLSYWYAGLYVVAEGWKALALSDPTIDSLLNSSNLVLLRRYRNGTFHFQKAYNDQRFVELIDQGEEVVSWERALNEQFGRYFLHVA